MDRYAKLQQLSRDTHRFFMFEVRVRGALRAVPCCMQASVGKITGRHAGGGAHTLPAAAQRLCACAAGSEA